MSVIERWPEPTDDERPGAGQVARSVLLRAVLPGVLVWAVVVGVGLLLAGPLQSVETSENSISRSLASARTATWNSITAVWSHIGNTEIVIGVCVVACLVILALTRRWWVALIPAIAIALQATIFVIATAIVGRDRPTVPHLDQAPPTSSYPSGHVGASTALYASLIFLASRIQRAWLRVTLIVVFAVIPFLVGYARLYRGMHHLSDVLVGAANGLVCAILAIWCIRAAAPRSLEAPSARR
jgi:membrane-associated phospholipid phosphatase